MTNLRPLVVPWILLLAFAAPATAWFWAHLGHGTAAASVQQMLLRLGVYAVLEEIVFRGGLQPWLATRPALAGRRWAGITAANALTSLVFATAHGFTQSPLQAAAIFPVSLVLGLTLECTGKLAAPVALHLYFNGLLWLASVAVAGR